MGATSGATGSECSVPSQRCILAVGHSHINTLTYAQDARVQNGQPLATHFHWIQLQEKELQPNVIEKNGRVVLHPELQRRLSRELASLRERPPFLAAYISGNEYFFVGHTEHPRPFDFALPGRDDLPVRSGVEIVPPSLVRKTLERAIAFPLSIMDAIAEAAEIPVLFIESPPPVASEAHIRSQPGPFREEIEKYGVAPSALRMKLWLLQCQIYRKKCDELGWGYLEAPTEGRDAAGYLQECGSWPDSVHANPWYGEFVLRRLEAETAKFERAEVRR